MKKIFYATLLLVGCLATRSAQAQYTFNYTSISTWADSACRPIDFSVQTIGVTSGLQVHTWYGDGTDDYNAILPSFIGGYANYTHEYTAPGTYTIKQVLELAGDHTDSLISSYDYRFCQTFAIRAYYDANSNCMFDYGMESYTTLPSVIAIDSNGVAIDTMMATSGFTYEAHGMPGDIYAFRVISTAPGMVLTCPSTGVVYDTISGIVNDYITKDFGFECSAITGYDAAEIVSTRAGRHAFTADILVGNLYCNATAVTLTMNLSPKYNFMGATPTPTSVSGNTITWNFPALSAMSGEYVHVWGEVPGTDLTMGDTLHSSYYLTPTTGDANPANNTVILVDTVRSSFDPNDKAVSPEGNIPYGAGTRLTYTLRFENTGNDTAFNIHIMDTLANELDVRSIEILGASHVMNMGVLSAGSANVIKFDFPHINLLDSSYHGLCDGFVKFAIKTRDMLPYGTVVNNRAGIYFDYNPVVMTNTTTNIIGIPDGVSVISNKAAQIKLYPNPAGSELTVDIAKGNFQTVSVVNSIGSQVLTQSLSNAKTKLNIAGLPAGTYFVTVRGESGVEVKQFVKL